MTTPSNDVGIETEQISHKDEMIVGTNRTAARAASVRTQQAHPCQNVLSLFGFLSAHIIREKPWGILS